MRAAYARLHALGWAHSVEAWDAGGTLAGGLYGVEVGGLFAAESKFHVRTDASKAAVAALVERLRAAGGPRLLDVQWTTPHLRSARGGRRAPRGVPRAAARRGGAPARVRVERGRVACGRVRYAAAGAGSSMRRGSSVSRAITRRWICDVPS